MPYYCVHKTLAGLLDVWRLIGNTQARDVLLAFAGWVDWRTGRLSYSQMQSVMNTEFGDGASREHYTLCRCGASANKPFCDGSHWRIEFRDP